MVTADDEAPTPLARLRAAADRLVRILLKYAVVAAVSLAAGLVVVALYSEYGYHPARNTARWAIQPIRFAAAASCTACHDGQVTAIAQRSHAAVDCQACHGPLADHARQASISLVAAAEAPPASPAACLTCHERVTGRPATFPMVTAVAHFGGAPCLLCHDPHTTVALAPPPVLHPLDRLPDCLSCHGPDGLRPMPELHPVWPDGDCLSCHRRPETATR